MPDVEGTFRTPIAAGRRPFVVGIGGTARSCSSSEFAVTEALRIAETLGAQIKLFNGDLVTRLPLYVPGRSSRNADEHDFIESIRQCDGVIVASPGYHGSLSGPIKNALDLLEDTAQDQRPYLDGRAFGIIVTAHGWQACGTTLVSLRLIAHALRAWPTPFGATLNVSTPLFDPGGTCTDTKSAAHLRLVATQVVEFACWRAHWMEKGTTDESLLDLATAIS